jgi:hypothetical protein
MVRRVRVERLLERELSHGDVACVLTEPALTNVGIVLPRPGFHDALRELTRRTGTLLIVDETHTLCAGPGGYTTEHGLEPDLLTVGKAIGSGIPSAAYGFSAEVAVRVEAAIDRDESDVGGAGGTLAANVLSLAAMRATLVEHVFTDEAFARMIALGERFERGVEEAIEASSLPWHVTRLGCRVEYLFRVERPVTGSDAAAGADHLLDRLIHLYVTAAPAGTGAAPSCPTSDCIGISRASVLFGLCWVNVASDTSAHAYVGADELQAGLDQIRSSPASEGTVELIVRRPAENEREVVEEGSLDVDEGLVGDGWRARGSGRTADGSAHAGMQLTLMNARVISLISPDRERWPLAGDQLFVDLDLSHDNLPAGTRLALGSAVIEVTDQLHAGCAKFTQRFGSAAIRFVNSPAGRALRLRGMYARVIEPGTVRQGDAARKL